MFEYRCTRNEPYQRDHDKRNDLTARQEYYIRANSEAEAQELMRERFPQDKAGFTAEFPTYNRNIENIEAIPTPNDCAFEVLMNLKQCRRNLYKFVVLDNLFYSAIQDYLSRKNINPSALPNTFIDEVRQLLLHTIQELNLT